MPLDWDPLRRELAARRDAGRVLPVWWRDDDAAAPSAALDRLLALAAEHDAVVHVAAIPAAATAALADRLADAPQAAAMVHGLAHRNHAPAGDKKAEFGAHRPVAAALADAAEGLAAARTLFAAPLGARFTPAFAPPWNRIAPAVAAGLPALGYRALSTYGPRPCGDAFSVNTHVDPIDWRDGRGLLAPQALIDRAAQALRRRREAGDDDEPFGLLTHHLDHDAAIWAFCADWLALLAANRDAVVWRGP